MESLRYSIFDPTGNITALVESEVPVEEQPAVAAAIMAEHAAVEQVGFVRFGEGLPSLRMAGGEFCGNAGMSAAALYLLRTGDTGESVSLRVSGAAEPVEIRLRRESPEGFFAGVRMPPALGVEERHFTFGGCSAKLPLVRMQGISHVIIPRESPFAALRLDRVAAERAVRLWCAEITAEGLGLMFLEQDRLTPLVYVPGGGTVFWENSCASGSAATAMVLAHKTQAPVSIALREPAGTLQVESDPLSGITWLWGKTRLIGDSMTEKREA